MEDSGEQKQPKRQRTNIDGWDHSRSVNKTDMVYRGGCVRGADGSGGSDGGWSEDMHLYAEQRTDGCYSCLYASQLPLRIKSGGSARKGPRRRRKEQRVGSAK